MVACEIASQNNRARKFIVACKNLRNRRLAELGFFEQIRIVGFYLRISAVRYSVNFKNGKRKNEQPHNVALYFSEIEKRRSDAEEN